MTRILPSFLSCFKHGLQVAPSKAGSVLAKPAEETSLLGEGQTINSRMSMAHILKNTTALGSTLPKMTEFKLMGRRA